MSSGNGEGVDSAPMFVHLSDIHFDAASVTLTGPNATARENLIDDLAQGAAALGTPDAVLVTGDIAFSGQAHQYEQARDFLRRVTDTLGIEPEKVQVVPGNHDVDRTRVSAAIDMVHEKLRSMSPLDADKRLRELFEDGTDPLFAPLAAYREFAQDYDCDVSGPYPFWEVPWDIGQNSILRMRGLTTCLVSDASDARSNLIVGTTQTSLATASRNDVVMVLGHHPPDWWHDTDESEANMRDYASLHLYGHKHVHHVSTIDNSVRLVAGAVHPERESDWQPRYNWVRLGLLGETGPAPHLEVQIWPRVMNPVDNYFRSGSEAGAWSPDVKTVQLARWARNYRPARPDPTNPHEEAYHDASPASEPPADFSPRSDVVMPPGLETSQPISPPPLSQRAAAVGPDGKPARIRTATYAFGALGYAAQQKFLVEFGLLGDGDRHLPQSEIHLKAFARLRDSGQLEEFIAAVERAKP